MANQRLGNTVGVAALNAASGTQRSNMNGDTAALGEHLDADYNTITALRARLAAIDASYYTAQRLDTMTYNDMVYAVRRLDSPTTIKA
jgi:hypothetical protein